MVLRTNPEANKWLHLTPRIAALGTEKEVNLAEKAEEESADFVNKMCQITMEAFWTQNIGGEEVLTGRTV